MLLIHLLREAMSSAELVRLGSLWVLQHELDRAEAAFRQADENGDAEAAFRLGMLFSDLGRGEDAERAFGVADERGSAEGASNLGLLLYERGEQALSEAALRRAELEEAHGDRSGSGSCCLIAAIWRVLRPRTDAARIEVCRTRPTI